MPDPNEQQEMTEAQKKMVEELSEKTDPFAGLAFEATGTNEPPPDQQEDPEPVNAEPSGSGPEKTADPAAQAPPAGALDPKLAEAEKRFNERLEKVNAEQGAQGEKQKLAQDHGLGPKMPQEPRQPSEEEMAMIQAIRQGDAQMQQAMLDELFAVVNKFKPPNIIIIGLLELMKDEYVRLSKVPPKQGNIAVPGGAPKPGGIVTPGGGPMPPRGGNA
jgi:hypothetical protein